MLFFQRQITFKFVSRSIIQNMDFILSSGKWGYNSHQIKFHCLRDSQMEISKSSKSQLVYSCQRNNLVVNTINTKYCKTVIVPINY
jgi:hypothetical protein